MKDLFKKLGLLIFMFIVASAGNAQIIDKLFINQRYLDSIQLHQSVYKIHDQSPFLLGIRPNYNQERNLVLNAFCAHEGGIKEILTPISNAKVYEWENERYRCYFTVNGVVEDKRTGIVSTYNHYSSIQTAIRLQFTHGNFRDQYGNEYAFDAQTGFSSGVEGMAYYEIMFDFGLGFDFDTMIFYENEDGGNLQGKLFRFEAVDTGVLHLFEVKPNWKKMKHKVSKKPIILTKI